MAILYRAQLNPGKLELVTPWVAAQPWAYPAEGEWESVATYRFDDPAGEVGMETFILRAGSGAELHVPVSYRGAPLEGAEASLIGMMEHSVLGSRWVYDACADPVYAQALHKTILSGGTEAEQYVVVDERHELLKNTAQVRGSGDGSANAEMSNSVETANVDGVTLITADTYALRVVRRVGEGLRDVEQTLTGTWATQPEPVLLSGIARS